MAKSSRNVRKTEVKTTTVSRSTRSQSKKSAAPAVEVEVAESEAKGMTLDDGIAVVVSLVLVAAIVLLDAAKGPYGNAIFF